MLLRYRLPLSFLIVVTIALTVLGFSSLAETVGASDEDAPEFDAAVVYTWASEGSTCGVSPSVLSAIAESVSNVDFLGGHAYDRDGTLQPALFGGAGDGTQAGYATLIDTDAGELDQDSVWDRPVGPFQILPASWVIYGLDANQDGVADPQNLWDASATAAEFLCGAGADSDINLAIRLYVGSDALAADVQENLAGTTEVLGKTVGRTTGTTADELVVLDSTSDIASSLWVLSMTELFADPIDFDSAQHAAGRASGDATGSIAIEPYDPELRGLVVRGDWDSDGALDSGLFTGGTLARSGGGDVEFGQDGDVAYVGDWDGDGQLNLGVWRKDPEGFGARFIMVDDAGRPFGAQVRIEAARAIPLIGDWDGDGRDSVAIFQVGTDGGQVTFFDRHGHDATIVSLAVPADSSVIAVPPELRTDFGLATALVSNFAVLPSSIEANVELVTVGGISVNVSIGDQVAAMLAAAQADGITLTGWGWRSHERQIELRTQNCADPFTTPSNQCSPPTATPGNSRHEFGLAIDFHIEGQVIDTDSAEFAWLSENAADFGLFNLPSEPWHWSDNGR